MTRHGLALCLILVMAWGSGAARAQDFSRKAGESHLAFAKRVLNLSDGADAHVTTAVWNSVPTLFVDYETPDEDGERLLLALRETPAGRFGKINVTTGEQEGGVPDIAAVGFANADHDAAKELIVILAWPQRHYDTNGTLYEVRIFDDPRPGQTALTLLKVSDKFGVGCDCASHDGKSTTFRFKTVAAVKAELKRLGY
jgi:hypothetical protein